MVVIDSVIITLVCDKQEYDMELPGKIAVGQLKPVIAEALSRKGAHIGNMYKLSYNSKMLGDSDTLLEIGAWDGSYITIVQEGR